VFTVMMFFAGERREGDLRHWILAMCKHEELEVLIISIDLATDNNWDISNPRTFHAIMMLTSEGMIDVAGGDPPAQPCPVPAITPALLALALYVFGGASFGGGPT
jgi:hypothetical protein